MAIVPKRSIYEILVRLHDGGPKGAHVQYLEWAEDDQTGKMIGKPDVTHAIPVSLADDADKLTIALVMGETAHGFALAHDETKAEAEEHRKNWAAAVADCEAKDANMQTVLDENAQLRAQLAEAQKVAAEAEGLRLDLEALRAAQA